MTDKGLRPANSHRSGFGKGSSSNWVLRWLPPWLKVWLQSHDTRPEASRWTAPGFLILRNCVIICLLFWAANHLKFWSASREQIQILVSWVGFSYNKYLKYGGSFVIGQQEVAVRTSRRLPIRFQGREGHLIRNWRQGDLCHVVTESSATLSLAVIQKVENEANELDGPATEISKQSVEDTKFFLDDYSEMQKRGEKLREGLLKKKKEKKKAKSSEIGWKLSLAIVDVSGCGTVTFLSLIITFPAFNSPASPLQGPLQLHWARAHHIIQDTFLIP